VIKAFFDESGAHGGPDDVFTVGGFVARESRWKRIAAAWDKQLGRRVFHMNHFENREGDFKDWPKTQAKRIELISALADSIQGNEAFGTAHSVDICAFHELMCPTTSFHQAKRLAYGFMLQSCLNDLIEHFHIPRGERLSVVGEKIGGIEGWATDCFYEFKRAHESEYKIGQITFAQKANFRGLQAADMMAYEGFKEITNQVLKDGSIPRRKLLVALDRRKRLAVAYIDRPRLEQLREKWIARLGQLPPWPGRNA